MYNKWSVDLNDSIRGIDKIRHDVLPKLISGDIVSIEDSDNEILIMFDQFSGIDYLRKDNLGLQGIASRVQFGPDYKSFSIRVKRLRTGAKTEYEKRVKQIENNYIYPYFTLQAYFDNREDLNLLSVCIIKTTDLYKELDTNPNVITRVSDNLFKVIYWDDIDKKIIRRYPNINN